MKTLNLAPESPTRIDILLAKELDFSRAQIQKVIKAGGVLVGGAPVTVKHLIEEPTTVEVNLEAFEKPVVADQPLPKLTILFENDDVMVIDKPAGSLVHPTEHSTSGTMVDALLAYYPAIKGVGEDPVRPGIVHRLDKDASGVLIVAKNQATFVHLKHQFKNRLTKKRYTVLVHERFDRLEGTIDFPISRSTSHGRMAAKSLEQGGREAISHYTVIEQFDHHALLNVIIETGRTHQIRVHMFALGHTVVGDRLYKTRKAKPDGFPRLFLHASELTITLPSGEEQSFEAPLPQELQSYLKTL